PFDTRRELAAVRAQKIWSRTVERKRNSVEWVEQRSAASEFERINCQAAGEVLFKALASSFLDRIIEKGERVAVVEKTRSCPNHPGRGSAWMPRDAKSRGEISIGFRHRHGEPLPLL